jgi:Peptidase family C25.
MMSPHNKSKRLGPPLIYSFVFILAYSLIAAGVPFDKERKVSGTVQTPNAPTQVTLNKFVAYIFNDEGDISLEWRSGYEVDNLGYNIYRERDGERRVQLNPTLIAGSALQAGQGVALHAGNSYAWRDKFSVGEQSKQVRYWLESIDLRNQRVLYGPIYARRTNLTAPLPAQSKLLAEYSVAQANAAQREWPAQALSLSQQSRAGFNQPVIVSRAQSSPELDKQWELAAQVCVKLSVKRDGWQRVTRAELLAAGLDQNASPGNLQLYLGGVEQAMTVNVDGSIEFYGQALDTLSTDTRVYWLAAGTTPGKRIAVSSAGPFDPNAQGGSFASTVERKDRTVRFAALLNGPGGNFFGPPVTPASMNQTLQVTGLDQTSAIAGQLQVGVQGLTLQAHQVRVQLNGADIGVINLNGRDHADAQFNVNAAQLRENKNAVTLSSTAGGSDFSLVDYVRLTYPRRYVAASNQLLFTVPGGQAVKATGFTTNALRVLDITDAANIKELTVSPQAQGVGGFAFTLPAEAQARTLFAIGASGSFEHPHEVRRNEPSSWHQTTHSANLLIITHEDFKQSLTPLRALREEQGLQVAVVDVEDVYDEFSFGTHSPQALRDFVERTRTLWQTGPSYLLLVGDGTADPRDYFGLGSRDFVPTIMVDSLFTESPSDDAFADFNNDGLPELAVGRLPVQTAPDAALVVNKILNYEQNALGDTQQRGAVMVSDQPDGYDFVAFTNDVRTSMPVSMSTQYINRTDGSTEFVRSQIQAAINLGPGVVNYLGHGSVGVWTGAGLLATQDAPNLMNGQRLSIFVMMTCLNGSFTEVGTDSLGEALLKAPLGGAVSVWASSGLTIPYGQVSVSKRFYELLFNGQVQRIGDATKQAKAATTDMDVRRLSILFGDPSMRFR